MIFQPFQILLESKYFFAAAAIENLARRLHRMVCSFLLAHLSKHVCLFCRIHFDRFLRFYNFTSFALSFVFFGDCSLALDVRERSELGCRLYRAVYIAAQWTFAQNTFLIWCSPSTFVYHPSDHFLTQCTFSIFPTTTAATRAVTAIIADGESFVFVVAIFFMLIFLHEQ